MTRADHEAAFKRGLIDSDLQALREAQNAIEPIILARQHTRRAELIGEDLRAILTAIREAIAKREAQLPAATRGGTP